MGICFKRFNFQGLAFFHFLFRCTTAQPSGIGSTEQRDGSGKDNFQEKSLT